MRSHVFLLPSLTILIISIALAGCATTTVTVMPSPQTPVCNNTASALVLWAPQWRPNQKDVLEREAAAEAGLKRFLHSSECFAGSDLRRLPSTTFPAVAAEATSAKEKFNKVVTITIRELGPVIKLLSSLALIHGGTKVLFQVGEYILPSAVPTRTFTIHWQNGGPGVIKGIDSLSQDMLAALVIGLQPSTRQK